MRKSTEQEETGDDDAGEIDGEEGRVHVGVSLCRIGDFAWMALAQADNGGTGTTFPLRPATLLKELPLDRGRDVLEEPVKRPQACLMGREW